MVRFTLLCACAVAVAGQCPDDPELDLCGDGTPPSPSPSPTPSSGSGEESSFATRQMSVPTMALALAVANGLGGSGVGGVAGPLLMSAMLVPAKAAGSGSGATTCGHLKTLYTEKQCCGKPDTEVDALVVPFSADNTKKLDIGTNPCEGKKPDANFMNGAFNNYDCVNEALKEQSGADVSKLPSDRDAAEIPATGYSPITNPYWKGVLNTSNQAHPNGPLCPVNVHWHLGAEHRSKGEYDETGKSPTVDSMNPATTKPTRRLQNLTDTDLETLEAEERRLAAGGRYGYACKKYDASLPKYSKPYKWKHCQGMVVGATYEVHWPHSILGACHTPWQYQTPFYDGVLCYSTQDIINKCVVDKECLSNSVGVQGQVFTIVNDESYYYPDLMRGMIVSKLSESNGQPVGFGQDVAYYTGSSTGTSRNNVKCSAYTPITWQVDRKCHEISASTFDKMCADMKQQYDDMSADLHAHGARELVVGTYTANNQGTMVGR